MITVEPTQTTSLYLYLMAISHPIGMDRSLGHYETVQAHLRFQALAFQHDKQALNERKRLAGQITQMYPKLWNPYRIIPHLTELYPYNKTVGHDSASCQARGYIERYSSTVKWATVKYTTATLSI